MTYFITEDCAMCGECEEECPIGCISEGEDSYVIDQEACVGCGGCVECCPAEAIVAKDE